jgi:cation transport protein ChaC
MTLTRADLENDRLRKFACQENPDVRILSEEELDASINSLLRAHPTGSDVWLFGYGSLVWNPIVHYDERRVARVHGYHRSFCLWSRLHRGSMQKPGLVLGLDVGGSCHGVAYRIAAHHAMEELRLLWRREMVVGSYCPRWVQVDAGSTSVRALTFIVNRRHANYAGKLPVEAVVKTLVTARGYLGTPAEYLLKTVHALTEHGVRDAYLMELRKRVLIMHPELGALA